MSTEEINQPVVAYFTFIQNNMAQITSGNATQVMREAEQRHLQIMHQVIGQLREEWTSRQAMREQEFEQRLQEAESGSIVAKAEYQKLSSEAVQALENAKASHQAEAEAQNLSLQDTIDDLQEQLDILKKKVHETAATGNGASDGGEADVILEIKTPAVLAAEAKAKLDKLLSPSKPRSKLQLS
eukprot:s4295_g5.t1